MAHTQTSTIDIMKTHDFVRMHSQEWSKKYPGKYLAIVDVELVSIGSTGHVAFKKAKAKYPDKEVFITYVPTIKEVNILI